MGWCEGGRGGGKEAHLCVRARVDGVIMQRAIQMFSDLVLRRARRPFFWLVQHVLLFLVLISKCLSTWEPYSTHLLYTVRGRDSYQVPTHLIGISPLRCWESRVPTPTVGLRGYVILMVVDCPSRASAPVRRNFF